MARAIDTITITEALRERIPQPVEIPFEGDGLLVILDPQEQSDLSGAVGKSATIVRPDGTTTTWLIAGWAVHHGVPGIFFKSMLAADVPRLSQISW
jgi:hypothetical protein